MVLAVLASAATVKKKIMDNFDTRKWFKKQYLEEDIRENRLYPDYDDIIELIKSNSNKNNSSEIDEAMDAMEFIGQHYGINFEFGRG